ncbi:hypothetical protein OG992_23830 [Micromonospora sp. NBC_00362]|uniref:hypothetical protein n=1 Tax=Micromonospora sp. NBC_00362 TaxID=2975975 RepID=UPI00225AB401|nr:hypothetical protein [Micromonospora sp. NBC_00362]MCX5120218.1 hypothetical protein [Micromonospora sp. NBC_00362]
MGTADSVSSIIPSGRAVKVVVDVRAPVASTGLPVRFASTIARSTLSDPSAGFGAGLLGAAAAGTAGRNVAEVARTRLATTPVVSVRLDVDVLG